MNKTLLFELAKKLNIPRRNCTKTKEELEEAINDTTTRYKEIIFGSNTPTCMVCLEELRKQQIIDPKIYDQKLIGRYDEEARMGLTSKKIVMDGDLMINK